MKTKIREYAEEIEVEIIKSDNGKLVILALNECGNNCTKIDLIDVIDWVKINKPELLK